MTREKLLALLSAVLTIASGMGWTQASRNDSLRLTAIETMAQALADCERRHSHSNPSINLEDSSYAHRSAGP